MQFYDKNHEIILSGDVLRFDNGIDYLVYMREGHLILQNTKKYTLPIILEKFACNGIVFSAIRLFNIAKYN